jgi:hypothetical protein
MRGTRAKRLRKIVYGDNAHRVREYKAINGPWRRHIPRRNASGGILLNPNGIRQTIEVMLPGTIVNVGDRRQYQILKSFEG